MGGIWPGLSRGPGGTEVAAVVVTPEEEQAWHETHCWACHRRIPRRWRVCCAECGHAWRWGWLLSLADARRYWQLGSCSFPGDICGPWWYRVLNYVRVRRPSRVWVCPCCSHDL